MNVPPVLPRHLLCVPEVLPPQAAVLEGDGWPAAVWDHLEPSMSIAGCSVRKGSCCPPPTAHPSTCCSHRPLIEGQNPGEGP